jgi:hypothetical protein
VERQIISYFVRAAAILMPWWDLGTGVALAAAAVQGDYVVLCPAAVGLHRGQVKAWTGYGRLAEDLRAQHFAGRAIEVEVDARDLRRATRGIDPSGLGPRSRAWWARCQAREAYGRAKAAQQD